MLNRKLRYSVMNCNKLEPITQEPLFKKSSKDDVVSLINSANHDYLDKGILIFNSCMPCFSQTSLPEIQRVEVNIGTSSKPSRYHRQLHIFKGKLNVNDDRCLFCPLCNKTLYRNGTSSVVLKHIPIGGDYTSLSVSKSRYVCSNDNCKYFYDEEIPFKAKGHFHTIAIENYTKDLLRLGHTLKEVSIITGLGKNIVKDIDKKRLEELYTTNGEGKELIRPKGIIKHIGIDEFLLHKGYKYATTIMDLDTGHVLYLAHGKKKQVVYQFIDWIGMDSMKHVEALACDMNSDYQEAFNEKCPWIKTVFDRFHLIKNFNEKVIANVRKDEQRRLTNEGNIEAAKALKGSKYILLSSATTIKERTAQVRNGTVIQEGGGLFNKPEIKRHKDYKKEYETLIKENELFFTIDLIKEKLNKAYESTTERSMKIHINRIIRLCYETENKHFIWFAKLLENHIEGIINHAVFNISSGKVEGTNNMVKTLRRKGYGYNDDDYFFLKIIDSSRKYS